MTPAINIRAGSKDSVPAAPQAEFLPKDEYNTKLVANGAPMDYENPEPLEKYDLVRRIVKCKDIQSGRRFFFCEVQRAVTRCMASHVAIFTDSRGGGDEGL